MPYNKSLSCNDGVGELPPVLPSAMVATGYSGSGGLPRPGSLPLRTVCRIVGHTLCHVRQISMYICHVALRIPLHEIGLAFGRDRTTVGHACHVVEDRRDDPAFDDFVGAIERIVTSAFSASGFEGHE